MISEIEQGLRLLRETGSWPQDPGLAAEVRRLAVEDETRLVRSDLDDEALDEQEKRTARVRQPLPAGTA